MCVLFRKIIFFFIWIDLFYFVTCHLRFSLSLSTKITRLRNYSCQSHICIINHFIVIIVFAINLVFSYFLIHKYCHGDSIERKKREGTYKKINNKNKNNTFIKGFHHIDSDDIFKKRQGRIFWFLVGSIGCVCVCKYFLVRKPRMNYLSGTSFLIYISFIFIQNSFPIASEKDIDTPFWYILKNNKRKKCWK